MVSVLNATFDRAPERAAKPMPRRVQIVRNMIAHDYNAADRGRRCYPDRVLHPLPPEPEIEPGAPHHSGPTPHINAPVAQYIEPWSEFHARRKAARALARAQDAAKAGRAPTRRAAPKASGRGAAARRAGKKSGPKTGRSRPAKCWRDPKR